MFHRAQALDMQRHVGKQIARRLELLLRRGLLGIDVAVLPGGAPTSGARSLKARLLETSLAVRNSGFLV